jgi:LysR family glycine cleavage system transcriptional activator
MLPSLKSLIAFETVVRHGSFSKAARELNVTQSAISHQIKNLEDYFELRLIDRTGSKLTSTPGGAVLHKDLSEAVSLVRQSVSQLRAHVAGQPLGISVHPHFAFKWLSPNLQDTKFSFDIRFFHSRDRADFSNSNIHLSIEWLHYTEAGANAQLLLAGNMTPACHPDLLSNISDPSDPAILKDAVLLKEADARSWNEWLAIAGLPGLRPARCEYHSDSNVRERAASNRQGFALVVSSLMTEEIKAGQLVCPFPIHLTTYAYYLVIPEDRKDNRKAAAFVEWLKERLELGQPA